MNCVAASVHYSIIVREAAILERGLSRSALLAVFEVAVPQGEGAGLISFGPHQGVEIADNLSKMLEDLGLRFVDDYFVFAPETPDWCGFGARLVNSGEFN
jgi:hypothetical protein